MEIETLRLFVAACDGGSIAEAARACCISPSLASRRIAALEHEVGAVLLLRTTRSLATTEAGATLLGWARAAVEDWNRLRDDIGAMQGRPSGEVRVASNDFAAVHYLPGILAEFGARYPEIRVILSIALEPARLLDGGCDIAIHAGRRPDANLVGRKVWEYERRLVATPAYLARRGTPRRPADLAAHACLSHTVSEPTSWCFEAGGSLFEQPVRPYLAADSWFVLLELAIAGLGVARLADALVRRPIEEGRLLELLPEMRSVYPDGEPPALWVLHATSRLPHRSRLLADHLIRGLRAGRRAPA
jgi:DNA-binding transcriptional LysR family regulator